MIRGKKKNALILGVVVLATIIMVFVLTKEQEKEYWYSDMVSDLSELSELMEDYVESIDEEEVEEAIYLLGQIRNASLYIAHNHRFDSGEATRDEIVVGVVVSEIWDLSRVKEFNDGLDKKLIMIYSEYMRINQELSIVNKTSNAGQGTFAFLADRLERNLKLKYPIDY